MELKIKKTNNIDNHYMKVLVYGASGTGKTTLAGNLPNNLILSAERGLLSLKDKQVDYLDLNDVALNERFEMLPRLIERALTSDYEWITIDSMSEITQLLKEALVNKGVKGFDLYGQVRDTTLEMCKKIRDAKKNVYIIGLEDMVKDENTGELFHTIKTVGKAHLDIPPLFDMVGYLGKRHGENGEIIRKIVFETDSNYVCKARGIGKELNSVMDADLGAIYKKVFGNEKDRKENNDSKPKQKTAK